MSQKTKNMLWGAGIAIALLVVLKVTTVEEILETIKGS